MAWELVKMTDEGRELEKKYRNRRTVELVFKDGDSMYLYVYGDDSTHEAIVTLCETEGWDVTDFIISLALIIE